MRKKNINVHIADGKMMDELDFHKYLVRIRELSDSLYVVIAKLVMREVEKGNNLTGQELISAMWMLVNKFMQEEKRLCGGTLKILVVNDEIFRESEEVVKLEAMLKDGKK